MSRPDPLSLRLPDELRSSLTQAATNAGRSLNAEIRMRLEWSLEAGFDGVATDGMLANEVESLRAELRQTLHMLSTRLDELENRLTNLDSSTSGQ